MSSANFWGLDSESFIGISEIACCDSCLSDCFCAAAVFNGQQCWKKRFPLSNGWVGSDVVGTTFIKVGTINSTTIPEPDHPKVPNPPIQGGGDKHQATVLIESIFHGSSVFLNLILLTLAVYTATFWWRRRKEKGQEHRNFSYRELEEATNGFKEVIGQGAYASNATVYKGLFDSEEGKVIAVLKLNEPTKVSIREFEGEVKAIARTSHWNLVQPIGFCNEEQHRLLVYEYMPFGSITDILFQGERPPQVVIHDNSLMLSEL